MNKTLQNEICAFIGDDPAQAVERVRKCGNVRSKWLTPVCGCWYAEVAQFEQAFVKQYGLADHGSALWDILNGGVYEMLALAATADAETRIAAMLWAAAWVVEVNENE